MTTVKNNILNRKYVCPSCNGKKKQRIVATEITSKGKRDLPAVHIDCLLCNGKGYLTEREKEKYDRDAEAAENFWCKCPDGFNNAIYFPDGTHPLCSKHCWACTTCDKIVQVG